MCVRVLGHLAKEKKRKYIKRVGGFVLCVGVLEGWVK